MVYQEKSKTVVHLGRIHRNDGAQLSLPPPQRPRQSETTGLDLLWNPTKLEQRRGRIQRIGQSLQEVFIANLRYRGSVEDRVHHLLSSRLEDTLNLFGQVPDVLEDVWIEVANDEVEESKKLIKRVNIEHPFDEKYNQVHDFDWESCSSILSRSDRLGVLKRGW